MICFALELCILVNMIFVTAVSLTFYNLYEWNTQWKSTWILYSMHAYFLMLFHCRLCESKQRFLKFIAEKSFVLISWDMEVIDVSSSDTEDYIWENEAEYPVGGSELHLQDTGTTIGEDDVTPSTESTDTPSPLTATEEVYNLQNDGDTTNNVSRSDAKTLKEHRFRRIFPPILPMVDPKGGFHLKGNESSGNTWQGEGGTLKNYAAMDPRHTLSVHVDSQYGNGVSGSWESKAKPLMGTIQKKNLPPLQPTVSRNVLKSSFLNDEDIQILNSHGKLDSFAGVEFNIPQYNTKDNMDANNNGFHIYKSAEHRRHLPPWMSGGSAAGQLAVSSSHSSLSTYPKSSGNHLSMGEKTIDEDERLIFQAALQVHREGASSFVFLFRGLHININ